MPITRIAAALIATGVFVSAPALAGDPKPISDSLCSPTVSAALTTWDAGLLAAGRFGDKAVAAARTAGREYLLPLFGVDKSAPDTDEQTTAISRALDATRQDAQQRLDFCMAVTEALQEAKGSAKAGWEALKRATDRFAPASPAAPKSEPTETKGDLIKT